MPIDPYQAMMSPQTLEEEEMRQLAASLRGNSSVGGRLSTSSLEPIQNQGRLMQGQADQKAQQIGLMQSRKMAADNKLMSDAIRASATDKDSPFNKITSAERRAAVENMATNNSEAMLVDTWKPEFQMQGVGGAVEWLAGKGMPMGEGIEDSVNYWKNYADWENKVRKSLFGSALTGYELKAWDKFTVNSKMDPSLVAKNMAIRKTVMMKKAAEEAANMLDYGWPPTTVQRMFKVLPPEAFDDLDAFADIQEASYKDAFDSMGEGGGGVTDLSDEDLMRMLGEL